ncbi:MAG: formylglycine-generating enzyme family protein [Puniceicoccales bacterium]
MDRRDHGFFYRFRKPIKALGLLILAAVVLTGAFFLSKLGPRPMNPDAEIVEFDEVKGAELMERSQHLENQFRERAVQRQPLESDYKLLDQAIEALNEYLVLRGGYHFPTQEKRDELYTLRDEYQARAFDAEIRLLVDQSAEAAEAGENEDALRKLERAHYLQDQINKRFDRSSYVNPQRLTQLKRDVEKMKAKPIFEESLATEAEAKVALEEENFGRAKLLMQRAIDLQKTINMEYRSLQYADVRRLAELQQQLASLESSEDYERILVLKEEGKQSEAAGNYAEAAEAYQRAFRIQRQLNIDFASSQFAGSRNLDELQALRENALSRDLGDDILAEMEKLDAALRERRVAPAIEIIRVLYPTVQQFTEQFPRSEILDENSLLKLQYLSAIEQEISFLQDRIYGQLLPIDGVDGWRMLNTEVAQVLYETVMLNANPSRNQGPRLPVDSGSWSDASDFAERVGWLLGRPARLPNQQEYYAALGSLRYVNLAEASWNLENSDGLTHDIGTKAPNSQGFHDLLGNVAEWLQSDSLPGDGEGYLAGGSAETSIDELAEVPLEITNRRTRNRYAGFRFVVNFSDE